MTLCSYYPSLRIRPCAILSGSRQYLRFIPPQQGKTLVTKKRNYTIMKRIRAVTLRERMKSK
ncbi:hypothetical protein DXB25_30525 [Lachnospiraceae bacterium OM02-31]|nr:hypothetical protein DXB25_30525 [Lachnospiraceae bacterium OM02-31]RJW50819.1 hypothetical protein DXB24_30795 [Lachnospiraceae bacterium OM02-3]